jgi:cell division protein FtsI (penicillin-binding protein 3)
LIVLTAPQMIDRRGAGARNPMVVAAHARLMVLMLVFTACVAVVVFRLALLAITVEPASAATAANALVPLRGDVVDRNGAPLARTIDAWSIGIHPKKVIGDKAALAAQLAAVIPDRTEAQYRQILESDFTFTYLKRRALPELVADVNALGEPGIAFAREPERLYPQATMAAHALGYLNREGEGMRGMERALNAQLVDPQARAAPTQLSIDVRVQAALQSELSRAMAKHSAAGAGGIVLDVNTGEVVAIASLPTFNPNNIAGATDDMLRNNMTQSQYELGSTFKPIAMAGAMDAGVVTSMSKRYDATAPLQVGRFRIRDDHAQNRWLNVPELLVHSSNIATARIADEMGQARMEKLFRDLEFDEAPKIEIREKGKPIWPSYWGRTTIMTTAYGHGIAVTPLHLAQAYAALVNGGILRPATMLKVESGKAVEGKRVFSQNTSWRMRQMLRMIVTEGTGRRAEAPGYRVGGKTGTAEKPGSGGYSRSVNVSTFAAAFPMDSPRYVVIAMLDAPKGTSDTFGFTGAAWTAAPVVSRVIQRTGSMLGVIPDRATDIDTAELKALMWRAPGEREAMANAE